MSNKNYLTNIRCPKCKQKDRFRISARARFVVTDEKVDGPEEEIEWDDHSIIECLECSYTRKVGHFTSQKGGTIWCDCTGFQHRFGCPNWVMCD